MAYPEPIPALNAKDARNFLEDLEKFNLTPKQKKFYRQMRAELNSTDKEWGGEIFSNLFSHDIDVSISKLKFEPFKTDTAQIKNFDCGEPPLNEFLCSQEVYNYQRERVGNTTLVFYEGELVAYYTLCSSGLRTTYVDDHYKGFSKLNEFKLNEIPAITIGRLATKLEWQNKGIGRVIVTKILDDALKCSEQTAATRLLLVQAKNNAISFYQKLGFQLVKQNHKERARQKRYGTSTMYFDLMVIYDDWITSIIQQCFQSFGLTGGRVVHQHILKDE